MKNLRRLLFFVAALTLILVACGTEGVAAEAASGPQNFVDPCPTGYTTVEIPVDGDNYGDGIAGGVSAFYKVPNQGCNLPLEACTYAYSGYGGGLSCKTIYSSE